MGKVIGTIHDDTLSGDLDADYIWGDTGNDLILGDAGRDSIYGGDGDDTLNAGSNDELQEYLSGGDGDDTYQINYNSGSIAIMGETVSSGYNDKVVFDGITSDDIVKVSIDHEKNWLNLVFVNEFNQRKIITVRNHQNIERYVFSDTGVLNKDDIDFWVQNGKMHRSVEADRYDDQDFSEFLLPNIDVNLDHLRESDGSAFNYAFNLHKPRMTFREAVEDGSHQYISHETHYKPSETRNPYESTQGNDIFILGNGDTIADINGRIYPGALANMGAGSDIVIAGGGADLINGGGGADFINGQGGNDRLAGDTYSDWLNGGNGNDWLDGGAMNDVLFGGSGSDTLDGGFALDVLFGGSGNDLIISRSDSGEPDRVARKATAYWSDGTSVSLPTYTSFIDHFSNQTAVYRPEFSNVQTNDYLDGGDGADLFVFEFTIGALPRLDILFPDNKSATTITKIDWVKGAELNDYRHQHWMDGIGNDRIYGFNEKEDTLAFIGHTVAIDSVVYADIDQDGLNDTTITLFSNHKNPDGSSKAHDGDFLGTVSLMGVVVDESVFNNMDHIIDVPVHQHTGSSGNWLQSNDPVVMAYLKKYNDLGFTDLVNSFGSFDTINNASAYFSSNLATIKAFQEPHDNSLSAFVGGSAGDDVLTSDHVGAFVAGGDGNDTISGTDRYMVQFGRDFIDGGAGSDQIYGGGQDDIIFSGSGNDSVLGGTRGKERNFGDEDIIFGESGNDTLNGGTQGDIISGGEGADIIISASDVGLGNYNPKSFVFAGSANYSHDATHRTMNDVLSGGVDSDTFVFDVLNAVAVNSEGHSSWIDTPLGTDIILDFNPEDKMLINFHGKDVIEGQRVDGRNAIIDGKEAAIITLYSKSTDNLYSTDSDGTTVDYRIIENNFSGPVGQIIVFGGNYDEVFSNLIVSYEDKLMSAQDYYDSFGWDIA